MGKIIPFRLPSENALPSYRGVPFRGNAPVPCPRPRKEPVVITVMPDQPFPLGHEDFRPLLQRNGLILLSWARYEDWNGDGSLLQRYVINWVASCGKHHHYGSGPVERKNIDGALPVERGNPYFYRGLYGNRYSPDCYTDRETADYVYLAAPFDLCKQTIPGFIRILKTFGSTVDFDCAFSLGESKKNQSTARQYLEKFTSTQIEKLNRQG